MQKESKFLGNHFIDLKNDKERRLDVDNIRKWPRPSSDSISTPLFSVCDINAMRTEAIPVTKKG